MILKKTAKTLKRSMHLLVFLNLIFAATTFSLLYFAGKKIQVYVLMIYAYAQQLQDLESVLSESISAADLSKLNEAMAVINQAYRMVFIITIISMIVFFLLWCFFQSLEWRIAYISLKKKIKLEELFDKHWHYALRFSLVTLPAFIIIFPSFYYLVAQTKALFLNMIIKMYGLTETTQDSSYLITILLFILVLITSYFTVINYVLLNKYKLLEGVKNSFKTGIKKMHILLPIHFACFIIILPILYLDSVLTHLLEFKAAAIISLLIYFAIIAYYQILMTSLLEKS